jgi:hypothetical protein
VKKCAICEWKFLNKKIVEFKKILKKKKIVKNCLKINKLIMKMNSASPKSSLVKLGLQKQKPFRVMILGQGGVGKTGRDLLDFLKLFM